MSFDCDCCCNKLPIAKAVKCPGSSCGYTVCATCQKTSLDLAHGCMSCKMTFTNKFLVEKLGKTFVNGPLRKFREEPLYEREKALLPETQPLVEWERIRRSEMAKTRFRQVPQIPPRPVIDSDGSATNTPNSVDPMRIIFPCPKNMCRGFVIRGKCGVCMDTICVHCREVHSNGHVCNKDVLESVRAINTECRNCPQCATMIYRTEGCQHMKCTACNSHFDWETGRLLAASSNHHYDNVAAFSTNVVRRDLTVSEGVCEDDTALSVMHDHIPREVFELSVTDTELISVLYDDPAIIRHTKTTKYMERNIVSTQLNSLVVDRVKFMLGELTEAKWKSRIFLLEKHKTLDLHIAEVLHIYLTTVRDFQSYARANATETERIKSEFHTFILMINDSFKSLQDEYGGACIQIRTNFSDPNLPAIII